jgi:hypothetical protein
MTNVVNLPMADLAPDHPAAQSMLRALGKDDLLLVKRNPLGPADMCYWNVLDHIARLGGGDLRLGWLIQWLPEVYVEATHHGVVQKADGSFLDVTPPSNRPCAPGWSTFVPDDSIVFDPRWPMLVDNRYLPLVDDQNVTRAIENYLVNNRSLRSYNQKWKRTRGGAWNHRTGYSGPRPNVSSADERELAESFANLHHHRARILERYFA